LVPAAYRVQGAAGAGVLGEDGIGLGRPLEGLRLAVALGEPGFDGGFQVGDALEDAAPDALARDFGEPAFDQIEPAISRAPRTHNFLIGGASADVLSTAAAVSITVRRLLV
jgi:hypothetical protein